MSSCGWQKNTLGTVTSRTRVSPAFALRVPNAIDISRSVTMPIARPFSTTGRAPQPLSQKTCATVARFVSGLQNRALFTITSWTFIMRILSELTLKGYGSALVPAHEHPTAELGDSTNARVRGRELSRFTQC